MRVVLDTNVLASAMMNPFSTPGIVLRKIIEKPDIEMVFSEATLSELKRVLFYPKIRKRIDASDNDIHLWIESLGVIAHLIIPLYSYEVFVTEDADDDIFIIAALEGKARYVVSGDNHLLKLKKIHSIEIIQPQEFLQFMDKQ